MTHRIAAALLLAALCATASAQTVTFNGSMGDKALLVIDGQPRTVALGATVAGVRLTGLSADEAKVEFGGRSLALRHGTPVSMGGAASGGGGQEIVLSAGLGGHFLANGSINGKAARFMVDTGATAISIPQADADRMGLNYRSGRMIPMNTANGTVPGYLINLTSVRIGDVETYNVQAVVMPAPMEHILLGNTFLSRFQMKRDNDTLRLEKRP
ncbi:retropepsin-like aspartic protease family protein [Ideonella sp. BN130291]|uniref:retropepsin-like aspartic protease family protein n=1 Tax=Ideonella sp. BN130291 TaxID=3112940 RepID=UPI002E25EA43|nr:retropepsin-like aspartic protease [Ideonella sp. BN130291]